MLGQNFLMSLSPGASTGIPGPIKSSIGIPVPKKWSDTACYSNMLHVGDKGPRLSERFH
jgi:hypothetical protein